LHHKHSWLLRAAALHNIPLARLKWSNARTLNLMAKISNQTSTYLWFLTSQTAKSFEAAGRYSQPMRCSDCAVTSPGSLTREARKAKQHTRNGPNFFHFSTIQADAACDKTICR
jgi:hypothetical protein